MNRRAFDALTPEQQEILRRAGHDALEPELARIEQDEEQALAVVCRHRKLTFVSASPSQLGALRNAVQPVYDELERDEETRELLATIGELRNDPARHAAIAPSCRGGRSGAEAGATALEGLWETTWTREELIAAGVSPNEAEAFQGHHTAKFATGRFAFRGDPGSGNSATGTYKVDGDVVRLVFRTGTGLQLGRPYELSWNVYRDTLTFSKAQGREALLAFLTEPYTRIR